MDLTGYYVLIRLIFTCMLLPYSQQCSRIFDDHQKIIGINCSQEHLPNVPSAEDWKIQFNVSALDIEIINFNENNLYELKNDSFTNFTNLRHLSVDSNFIDHVAIDAFDGLHSLEYLSLVNNYIEDLDKDVFKNCCQNLTYLSVKENNFTSIPDVGYLPALTYLNMVEISYPQTINVSVLPEGFSGPRRLENLTMTAFNMTIVGEDFFSNLTSKASLKELYFAANTITYVHPNAFDGFSELLTLNLDLNGQLNSKNFDKIMRSMHVSKLRYLSCFFCRALSRISNETFAPLKNTTLREVWLSHSNIESFHEDAFKHLPYIEILYVDDTYVTTFPPELFAAPRLSMRYLDISTNSRLEDATWATANMTNLTYLDISACKVLTVLHANASDGLHLVTEYYLYDSDIRYLADYSIKDMHSVRVLDFSQNTKLGTVDEYAFHGAWSVEKLYLDNTHILDLHPMQFENMTELNELSAAAMNVTSLPDELFQDSRKLVTAVLTGNQLMVVNKTFANLSMLSSLSVDGNQIQDIDNRSFQGCSSLVYLDMSAQSDDEGRPHMNHVPKSILTDLYYVVQTLMINNNNISMFSINETNYFKDSNHTLKRLLAHDNPFDCRCYNRTGEHHEFLYFVEWFNSTIDKGEDKSVLFPETKTMFTCGSPKKFKGEKMYKFNFKAECVAPFPWVLFLSTFLPILFTLAAIIGTLLYKYRWSIKYWWYKFKLMFKLLGEEDEEILNPMIEFDAMLCHGQSHRRIQEVERHDIDVIEERFLPKMSVNPKRRPFRFCMDYMHFSFGEDHMNQIHTYMNLSRKVVIILTKNFLSSPFGLMELEAALGYQHHFNKPHYVIICCMEDPRTIIMDNIPMALQVIMEKRQYLYWPKEDEDGQNLFWLKLSQSLMKPNLQDFDDGEEEVARPVEEMV